jgi:hypothetical protein
MPGETWVYCCNVVMTWECPRRSLTALTLVPPAISSVAMVCLVEYGVKFSGSPAAFNIRLQAAYKFQFAWKACDVAEDEPMIGPELPCPKSLLKLARALVFEYGQDGVG